MNTLQILQRVGHNHRKMQYQGEVPYRHQLHQASINGAPRPIRRLVTGTVSTKSLPLYSVVLAKSYCLEIILDPDSI